MRVLAILFALALAGCQSTEIPRLQQDVMVLKQEIADINHKLDRTSKTASSANAKASNAAATAKKLDVKVESAKQTADRALESANERPLNRGETPVLKPREINHETSIIP